jgi:hypothetical protein
MWLVSTNTNFEWCLAYLICIMVKKKYKYLDLTQFDFTFDGKYHEFIKLFSSTIIVLQV